MGGTLSLPSSLKDDNVNLPHDFVFAPYNNIEETRAVIASLPKNSLAVVIVECIQGSGGCIVGTTEFLQFLDTTTKEIGALFIIDEVMTSRLSYHGYASSLGLKPDLVTLGKWIGGGMTFGAFGGRKDVMDMFGPRSGLLGHSGTFNNNIVTMAAGCAGIDIYNEVQVKRLNGLGEDLKSRLDAILLLYWITMEKYEVKPKLLGDQEAHFKLSEEVTANRMWVTGKGSMLNIHFAGESADSLRGIFWHHMLEYGFYMAQRGFIVLNIELKETDTWRFFAAVEVFVKTHLAHAQGLQ